MTLPDVEKNGFRDNEATTIYNLPETNRLKY